MAPVLVCPFPVAFAAEPGIAEHGGTLHTGGMQGSCSGTCWCTILLHQFKVCADVHHAGQPHLMRAHARPGADLCASDARWVICSQCHALWQCCHVLLPADKHVHWQCMRACGFQAEGGSEGHPGRTEWPDHDPHHLPN